MYPFKFLFPFKRPLYKKDHLPISDPFNDYLKFCGFTTLNEATSPQFLQKVIWSGDPTAMIAPIGLILPWLVVPPTCPVVNLSRPQALHTNFSFSILSPHYVIYVNYSIKTFSMSDERSAPSND